MLLLVQASFVAAVAATPSAAPEQCASGDACHRSGGLWLVQHRSQYLKRGSANFEEKQEQQEQLRTAWVASAFGDCTSANDGSAMKSRTVECIDVKDKTVMSGSCESEKPCASKPCVCPGLEPCVDGSLSTASPECNAEEVSSSPDCMQYEEIGCIALDEPDKGQSREQCPLKCMECMSATGSTTCRDGLPFFSANVTSTRPVDTCFRFCTSKGLDLFGVLSDQECRCGASLVNEAAWHEETPRTALLFDWTKLSKCTDETALKVYRYTGHFEATGLPASLLDIHEDELTYLDSVVTGKLRAEEAAEDGYSEQDATGSSALQTDSKNLPRCSGGQNCGPGTPWQVRKSSPPAGMPDKWQEYVEVPYFFSRNLDNTRKEAFREAARRVMSKTCIVPKEVSPTARPNSEVGSFDSGSCYVTGLGYPGRTGLRRVNLGWCNSMRYVGSMVHEIGHLIGMNHEQKRPDAGMSYKGHGPYLKLFWQNIPSRWVPQYLPDMKSYVGSANDGPGDPHVGYADYDFGSIMHYPGGKEYDTIPADKERLTGNRRELTAGDVEQILDMYQCKRKGSGPRPTPRPVSRPTPRPTPKPGQGPCKDTDARCTTKWRSKCSKKNVQRKCPLTCGACGGSGPTPRPSPPGSCMDKSSKCAKKWKGKCTSKKVKKNCPKMCGLC